jgi:diacylglycerol O-acyltransferase / trehalose O-mycolyltransferase
MGGRYLRRDMRRLLLPAALCLAALPAPAASADTGIRLLAAKRVDTRLSDLTMSTPALAAPVHVRILVPSRYGSGSRRYPVLYLLHGSFDDYRSWTDEGAAEKISARLQAIVVMPEGGDGGWYTNWFRPGPPDWETFHIDQLLPWVDAHYRTIPTRGERAIAGLSMGGFGALSYAARHPDLFAWAASFSGAVDIVNNGPVAAVIDLEAPADGGKPGDQFGDRVLNAINWRAHNPWDLAANLRGLRLRLDTGDGRPGPFDKGRLLPDPIEQQVHAMSVSLHDRLSSLGIAHVWDDYGAGTHAWPYWQRDLRRALPSLQQTFAHPPRAPRRVTYTSAESSYEVYGWQVSFQRAGMAFSTLANAGRRGFSISGSGTVTVVTPPLYTPSSLHRVTVAGSNTLLRADGGGSLKVTLALGTGAGALVKVR